MMCRSKYLGNPQGIYLAISSKGNRSILYGLPGLRTIEPCRWNYLLRIKVRTTHSASQSAPHSGPLQTHSRIMPFLLPPAEFRAPDLDAQGLSGTCEVQICRSAGNWSMGLQICTEQSIQNAYLKGSPYPFIISEKKSYREI